MEYDRAVRTVIAFALFAGLAMVSCKDDKPTPDATPPDDTAGAVCGAAATVEYLGVCTGDAECGTCVCRSFGHTMNCTLTCDGPEDCPAPSPGCSNGVCRL